MILELGCHDGTSTALLRPFCKSAVGLDKGEGHIAAAKKAFQGVDGLDFVQGDALDIPHLMSLHRTHGPFSVVFVDISGSRHLTTLLPLLEHMEKALKVNIHSSEVIVRRLLSLSLTDQQRTCSSASPSPFRCQIVSLEAVDHAVSLGG